MNTTRIQAKQLSLYRSQVVAGVERIHTDLSLNNQPNSARALKRKEGGLPADSEFANELERAIDSLTEHH
jgi:hypothetical protein